MALDGLSLNRDRRLETDGETDGDWKRGKAEAPPKEVGARSRAVAELFPIDGLDARVLLLARDGG